MYAAYTQISMSAVGDSVMGGFDIWGVMSDIFGIVLEIFRIGIGIVMFVLGVGANTVMALKPSNLIGRPNGGESADFDVKFGFFIMLMGLWVLVDMDEFGSIGVFMAVMAILVVIVVPWTKVNIFIMILFDVYVIMLATFGSYTGDVDLTLSDVMSYLTSTMFIYTVLIIVSVSIFIALLIVVATRLATKNIRVFCSFSGRRSRYWGKFISRPMKIVFFFMNISYFDYRAGAKRTNPLNIPENCNTIDRELQRSDVYVRFYDVHVANRFILTQTYMANMIDNRFTNTMTPRNFDYLNDYEVEKSAEFFGGRHQRIEVVLLDEMPRGMGPDERRVSVVYHLSSDSQWMLAIALAKKIRRMYRVLHGGGPTP